MKHTLPLSVLALVALFLLPQKADAQGYYMTARELLQFCNSKFNSDYGYCAGYVTGIADELLGGGKACHKVTVKSQQLRDITLRHIEKHPENLDRPARNIVQNALTAAFPCR